MRQLKIAEKAYQLSLFFIDGVDEDIRCEEFTVEEKTATNSHNAYTVDYCAETITWSCDSVDPKFHEDLLRIYNEQLSGTERFNITTFDYNKHTGELETDDVL